MTDSSTNVIFNGVVTTIGRVGLEKHKTSPQAKVVYHELVPNETRAGEFTLKLVHRIAFASKEAEIDTYTATNIGSTAPFNLWKNNVSEIIWSVRWTAKGLMPVRPLIYTRVGMKIPTDHAVVVE